MDPLYFRILVLTALFCSVFCSSSSFGQGHTFEASSSESGVPKSSLAPECDIDISSTPSHYPNEFVKQCGQRTFSETILARSRPPEIGDRREFNINPWSSLGFILRDKSSAHYLWVEESQLDRITDSTMQSLKVGLVESTPEGSYNSEHGIIEILHNVFGPQVKDADGMVDILFYYFIGSNPYQDGYVISPTINDADVLFLNSNDTIYEKSREWMLGAVAHEYLHVLHMNYMDLSKWEIKFIAEGIAMAAMYVTGYSHIWFSDDFLNSADDLNRPFSELRTPSGDPVYPDHMRAGLFHTYLAVQHGLPILRDIMRKSGIVQGFDNLKAVLAEYGTTLEDAVVHYHLANFLNDPALGRRYSYPDPALDPLNNFSFPELANIRIADTPSAFTLHVAGDTTDTSPETQVTLREGGVIYGVWENVEDFELSLDVVGPGSQFNLLRSRLRPHVVLEREDGSLELKSIEPGTDATVFAGHYERISLAVIHVDPREDREVDVQLAASWSSVPVTTEKDLLPGAIHLAQNYPNPFNPSTTIEYSLSRPTPVRLAVYDMLGREVEVLVDEARQHPGSYTIQFRASHLSSGTYIVRLETENQKFARSMSVLR